ncbi:MAG: glutathione synthase [Pseudomonadota bacterium]
MGQTKFQYGVVMDAIGGITPAKDSTLAMMLEIQARGGELWVMQQSDLYIEEGTARARATPMRVFDDNAHWYEAGDQADVNLAELDVILMRKDPPFDMEFIYTTYILEVAERGGCLVVNKPAALRDLNEKASTAWFPELAPDTLITRSMAQIKAFLAAHEHIVVKPLDGMGGRSIFSLRKGDTNTNVVLETLTDYGQQFAMAQTFLPEITDGDKRVLLIDGAPVEFMLARVPNAEDGRGNLVMGATGDARPLGEREREIAVAVGKMLRERGVLFAGLDIIGSALTEINVTSPTGIRELDKHFAINIAGMLLDAIERRLSERASA